MIEHPDALARAPSRVPARGRRGPADDDLLRERRQARDGRPRRQGRRDQPRRRPHRARGGGRGRRARRRQPARSRGRTSPTTPRAPTASARCSTGSSRTRSTPGRRTSGSARRSATWARRSCSWSARRRPGCPSWRRCRSSSRCRGRTRATRPASAPGGSRDAGADIVGVNCLNGPEQQLPIAVEMRAAVEGYVAAQPVAYRTSAERPDFTALPSFPYELDPLQLSRHEMAAFARRAPRGGRELHRVVLRLRRGARAGDGQGPRQGPRGRARVEERRPAAR